MWYINVGAGWQIAAAKSWEALMWKKMTLLRDRTRDAYWRLHHKFLEDETIFWSIPHLQAMPYTTDTEWVLYDSVEHLGSWGKENEKLHMCITALNHCAAWEREKVNHPFSKESLSLAGNSSWIFKAQQKINTFCLWKRGNSLQYLYSRCQRQQSSYETQNR